MTKHRYTAGFWVSLVLAGWSLFGLSIGLKAVANNPDKYVNDVMIPSLVLIAGVASLFIWLAFRVRRKGRSFTEPS